MRVSEGGVEVEVPDRDGDDVDGPTDADGPFYNPDQELNRDVTVAVLRAYRDREPRAESYLDAMAATGVRGVRAAREGWQVTLADRDPEAVDLCRENLAHNDLAGEVVRRDANALLHDRERVFDVTDLDPFGSPVPFADAALANTRNLVCATATDTAPLCGAHFRAGVRRYSTVPRNTEYHAEVGVRVLLSALVRTAARYDAAATPLVTHATRHYVRTYLELDRGATVADDAIDHLGFVHHCEDCLHRDAERSLVSHPPDTCPACGGDRVLTAGPLWLGPVRDRAFVAAVREAVDDGMGTADRARDVLATLQAELDTPTHYDHHRLCKLWGRAAEPMDEVLDALRAAGFEASRTHYGGTTLKTDATVAEIRAATEE